MGTVTADKNDREVYMKISFLKISDISTISESFTADVFLQARWREPALDHSRNVNTEINWNSYWNPKIVIPNILSERKHLVWNMLQTDENGQTYVLEKHRIKAVFAENQELLQFPFDIQDLSILVSSSLSVEEVSLLEDDREVSNVHTETFTKQQEWSLYDCVTFTSTELTKEYANTMYKNPGMYINCMAKRRGGFFIWNVMLIMAIITSLSLATFAVSRTKTENRLQLTFMLVLTSVTFKFVTNQILPKISYITHFDGYIIGSMMFLYSVALFHALTSIITDHDTLYTVDWWGFIGFLSFYAFYNIIFIIIVIISVYPRWSSVNKMVDTYQAKKELIQGSGHIQNTGKFRAIFRRKTTKIKISG